MNDQRAERAVRRRDATLTHGNKHGFRGVEWSREKQLYRARIEPAETGKRGRWLGYFASAEAAARAYDDAARETYGLDAHLNFPNAGEKATIKSRAQEGFCPRGHDLSLHGRLRASGRRDCRKCNLEAVKRYQSQKKVVSTALAMS